MVYSRPRAIQLPTNLVVRVSTRSRSFSRRLRSGLVKLQFCCPCHFSYGVRLIGSRQTLPGGCESARALQAATGVESRIFDEH
jgi:hypothetical protein